MNMKAVTNNNQLYMIAEKLKSLYLHDSIYNSKFVEIPKKKIILDLNYVTHLQNPILYNRNNIN